MFCLAQSCYLPLLRNMPGRRRVRLSRITATTNITIPPKGSCFRMTRSGCISRCRIPPRKRKRVQHAQHPITAGVGPRSERDSATREGRQGPVAKIEMTSSGDAMSLWPTSQYKRPCSPSFPLDENLQVWPSKAVFPSLSLQRC